MATLTGSEKTVALFHALSDETRLAILEMLRGGERCVCELQDELSAVRSKEDFDICSTERRGGGCTTR